MTTWRTGIDVFNGRVRDSGPRVALRYKADGFWRSLTWNDWDRAAREIAAGLRALGVGAGDRVCVLAGTRVEWLFADVGILMAGGVTVPIYASNTPDQCEYIINDCQAKVVIVEDPHQLGKLLATRGKLGGVSKVVLMGDVAALEKPDAQGRRSLRTADVLPGNDPWVLSLSQLRASGTPDGLEKGWPGIDGVKPDDIFTIVYTSGTTGPPKGVVLTHGNLVFEINALSGLLDLGETDEQLLFLPLAHIFGRALEWSAISKGFRTSIAESIPKLVDNAKEVRPTLMGAVPRVYEKAYAKIQGSFAEKRKKPATRLLLDWAEGVARRRSQALLAGRQPGLRLSAEWLVADKLVFAKIRETFGGRLRFFISGGAPLAREIAEFFHAAGLLILEAYGLTETTGGTHLNTPRGVRFGAVGQPLPGVDIRIAADGEILARGGNIMQGYFGKPEATREVIDPEGWFHTGDIGVIEDGFLRITDRKKDIIVTAGGKNVAPQNIESALKSRCPYVSQVMVHGDKRNYLTALVTLSEENLTAWAKDKGLPEADLAARPEVKDLIQKAVDGLNSELASYETIKKFAILPRDLSQDAGELTPTLKVKRKFCSEKYKGVLDAFYESESASSAP